MKNTELLFIICAVLVLFFVAYSFGEMNQDKREHQEKLDEILSHCVELNFTKTCQDFGGQIPYCCGYKPELVARGLI